MLVLGTIHLNVKKKESIMSQSMQDRKSHPRGGNFNQGPRQVPGLISYHLGKISLYCLDTHDGFLHSMIQSNFDNSNTDGSFTMANSNSFLSPYEVLPIAQENIYLGWCSYFIVKLYVVCTH